MSSIEDIAGGDQIPVGVRQFLSLTMTVIAAALYAAILGYAIVGTLAGAEIVVTTAAIRAAQLLSGLVGSVVTAGFARSKRPVTVQVIASHPMGGRALTAWRTLRPPSLLKRNLMGLADTLGLRAGSLPVTRSTAPEGDGPSTGDRPTEGAEEAREAPAALWVAILYLAVYFLVGLGAFALTVVRSDAPEIISNAGWVWLGTIVSSGYSFFALDSQ